MDAGSENRLVPQGGSRHVVVVRAGIHVLMSLIQYDDADVKVSQG
jgi:hypothetical protein